MKAHDAISYNLTNRLGGALWKLSTEISGLNTDKKMVSIMLFKRLWSHHRGYALLHNAALYIETDTLLRSSVEAAICIAANFNIEAGLSLQLRQDAIHTVEGQIKRFREAGDTEMVSESEATLRQMRTKLPAGLSGKKLDMKTLAKTGNVPILYELYRALSGMSSHVTGLSILNGVVFDEDPDTQDDRQTMARDVHPQWQMVAMLQGCHQHALLLGEIEHAEAALTLIDTVGKSMDSNTF